jgi:diguanylate cyclase (GGDEF)-like protein
LRVQALGVAGRALQQGKDVGAVAESIRRIGHSFRIYDASPEIASLARMLTEARDKGLRQVLGHVLPRLQTLAEQLQQHKYLVLIVEDDPVTSAILKHKLGRLYRVLAEQHVSLLILDLQLPDGDGREFLLKMRESSVTTALPIFVISSQKSHEIQTECFALGADAYFCKPFDPVTLCTALVARLQKTIEITLHSSMDPLTGLPHRAGFSSAFQRATLLASRSSQPLTVAMLDVDRFKSVNDLYGHSVGDQVLRRLAAVLSASLRASDFLARWGGEEFSIFFPNTDLAEAALALNKALKAFRAERFLVDGRRVRVTFSAGLTRVTPGMNLERAMGEADRLLYLAKSSGRNHVVTEADKVSLKKRILLIEDDNLTAQILKTHLQRNGYQVVHASEGKGALAAADSTFSLITLDVKIPHGDGFSLLQKFRRQPALAQVPIVMVTTEGRVRDIVRGFQMGADDYIVKPFSPRELLARLHRLLDKH